MIDFIRKGRRSAQKYTCWELPRAEYARVKQKLAWQWSIMEVGKTLAMLVVCGVALHVWARALSQPKMESLRQGKAIGAEDLVSVYGCTNCHEINGSSENPGNIGPPLTNWQPRRFIAGRVPNVRSWLVRWILDPQSIDPGTAMPDLGVSTDEAGRMADYLYTQ